MASQAISTASESIRPGHWSRINQDVHHHKAASATRTNQVAHKEPGHSLLEFTSSLGASLDYGRKAYNQGVREGWSAYWLACKSWIPRSVENRKQGLQNPVRHSWDAFLRGMSETEKPDVELFKPMQRALTLYGAFNGGSGRVAAACRDPLPHTQPLTQSGIMREDDEVELVLEGIQFLEDVGKLLQLQ